MTGYVTTSSDRVRRFSASTGALLWQSDPLLTSSHPLVVSGTGSDDGVYVGGIHGVFHRLSSATGQLLQTIQLPDVQGFETHVTAASYADGVFYVAAGDGVFAVRLAGGSIWKYTMDDLAWGTPVVVDGRVYSGSWDGRVHAIALDGTVAWVCDAYEFGSARPIVVDGVVYVDGYHVFVALDAESGAVRWAAPHDVNFIGGAAHGSGRVYASDWKARVIAYDAIDGHVHWTTQLPAHVGRCAFANGRVFLGAQGGPMRAVDATDGHVIWTSQQSIPEDEMPSLPAIENGLLGMHVFITSQIEGLYAFRRSDGALAWMQPLLPDSWPENPTWSPGEPPALDRRVDTPSIFEVAIDPLALILRSDVYIRLKLPYPPPPDVLTTLRKLADDMTPAARRQLVEGLRATRALTEAIERVIAPHRRGRE